MVVYSINKDKYVKNANFHCQQSPSRNNIQEELHSIQSMSSLSALSGSSMDFIRTPIMLSEATTTRPLPPFLSSLVRSKSPPMVSVQSRGPPMHIGHSMISLPSTIYTPYGYAHVLDHSNNLVSPLNEYRSPETFALSCYSNGFSSTSYPVHTKNSTMDGCQGCCPMTHCPNCQDHEAVQDAYSSPCGRGSTDPWLTKNYYSSPFGSSSTRSTASPYLVVDIPGIFRGAKTDNGLRTRNEVPISDESSAASVY